MKPEISIIIPGIRVNNWLNVFDSIVKSTQRTFEVIFCGPYTPPEDLLALPNVKFVRDFGSPTRAQQIAATLAEGELITWSADDALFIPDALDSNINILLHAMEKKKTNVVVAKYFEGVNGTQKPLQNDDYFKLHGSTWTASPFIPKTWWLFNVGVMYRSFFEELGGWDCEYEGTFYSHADMAVRAQFLGATVRMSSTPMLDCDHSQPDHPPIESAQVTHDKPLYFQKYLSPTWSYGDLRLDINNWKKAPTKWTRRFK